MSRLSLASPVAELLPHQPPMRLLTTVDSFEGAHLTCTAALAPECPFADASGAVDPLITVELVAQAAAAWAALTGGDGVRPGVIASCREATFEDVPLRVGDVVRIATERIAGDLGFGSFAGVVTRNGTHVATISVGVVLGGAPDPS